MTDLTAERLRELLQYDPETGWFIWRVATSSQKVGGRAGSYDKTNKYRAIKIDGRLYREHRLAWLYVTGLFPPPGLEIDHANGDRIDNRLSNLRLATRSQNQANKGVFKNNTTGYKGVSRNRRKFRAAIHHNGRYIHIGNFETTEAAHEAYKLAASELYGEFARAA